MTTPNPLIVMEGGMVRVDDSGNIRSGEGCCCDPCPTCPEECCVIINGRDTCVPGTAGAQAANSDYEQWGGPSGAWDHYWSMISYYGCYPPHPFSCPAPCGTHGKYSIGMTIGDCDEETGETPVTVYSYQSDWECSASWLGRQYVWTGVLTKDSSGCPTGFTLDEDSKVTTYGGEDHGSIDPADDSGVEPLDPLVYITFECNPLP